MALIHLDAGVIIGLLNNDDAHHVAARSLLADALRSGDRLAMASSAFAECLVAPARSGEAAVSTVRQLFERVPITIVPLTEEIAIASAHLRARHKSLRLPDAIVIATAAEEHARELVTTDHQWPTASALGITATLKWL